MHFQIKDGRHLFRREQLCRRTFQNFSFTQPDHVLHVTPHHRQVVAGHQDGLLLLLMNAPEQFHDGLLHCHVDAGGRLVQQKKIRLRRQRTGDEHALLLAAGQLRELPAGQPAGICLFQTMPGPFALGR